MKSARPSRSCRRGCPPRRRPARTRSCGRPTAVTVHIDPGLVAGGLAAPGGRPDVRRRHRALGRRRAHGLVPSGPPVTRSSRAPAGASGGLSAERRHATLPRAPVARAACPSASVRPRPLPEGLPAGADRAYAPRGRPRTPPPPGRTARPRRTCWCASRRRSSPVAAHELDAEQLPLVRGPAGSRPAPGRGSAARRRLEAGVGQQPLQHRVEVAHRTVPQFSPVRAWVPAAARPAGAALHGVLHDEALGPAAALLRCTSSRYGPNFAWSSHSPARRTGTTPAPPSRRTNTAPQRLLSATTALRVW